MFDFYDTIDSLIHRIASSPKRTSDNKELSKEELLELESLFGTALLQRVLHLLYDKKIIKLYRTPNGSGQLIEVPGSKCAAYKIFPDLNFCTCVSFKYWVLQQHHQPICKHILATKLAVPLERVTVETIPEKSYIDLKAELIKQRLDTVQKSTGEGPSHT